MAGPIIIDPNDLAGSLRDVADRLMSLEQTSILPVGLIGYCPAEIPDGWLFCDGSAYDTTRYGQLFAYLKAATLPNLDGMVVVGRAAAGTFAALGATGGVESVTLSGAESGMPAHVTGFESISHVHTILGTTGAAGGGSLVAILGGVSNDFNVTTQVENNAHTHSVSGVAASSAHTNMPPYVVLNPMIKF